MIRKIFLIFLVSIKYLLYLNLRFDKADEVLDRTLEFPAIRRIKLILDFEAIVIS